MIGGRAPSRGHVETASWARVKSDRVTTTIPTASSSSIMLGIGPEGTRHAARRARAAAAGSPSNWSRSSRCNSVSGTSSMPRSRPSTETLVR